MEYNFGGYYGANQASGAQTNFPTRTIKLPENGKAIRSAWLEFEGLAVSAASINPLVIMFDAGPTAATARFTSGQYTNQTGESIRLFARADVTSAINAELAQLAAGRQFTAAVTITGPTSNMHTLKLYITYEYDDLSPVQVKTVRFPLYSDYAAKIAAFTAQQPAGTSSMQYLAGIPDLNSMQQQWFEIRGFRQTTKNSTADGTLYLNINGGTNEPTINLDGSLHDSYNFRYLSNSDFVAGFSTGTLQTVNIPFTQNPINLLSGEAVITYEADASASTKLQTVRYYLGQGLPAATTAYLQSPLYLREEGINLKEVYLRVSGSFRSATADSLPVDSAIGGVAVPQRLYSIQSLAAEISGYQFFHSLTGAIAGWTNGAVIGSTVAAVTNTGGSTGAHGAEIIATYEYANDAAHTSHYQVYAGNSADGSTNLYPYSFSTWFPEQNGAKTARGGYVFSDTINGRTSGNFTTTADFNGNSPEGAVCQTISEATDVNQFYQNLSQVSAFPVSVTVNYSLSQSRGTMGGGATLDYTFVPVPKLPVSLAQKKPDNAVINTGAYINGSSANFEAVLASSMTYDNLYPALS